MIVIGMLFLFVVALAALQYIADYRAGNLQGTDIDENKNNKPNSLTGSSQKDINSEINQNSTLKVDLNPAYTNKPISILPEPSTAYAGNG